jgi:hypothetical protein
MAVAARLVRPEQMREPGAYLTDEKRLYRVVDAARDEVRLENCRYPEETPVWVPVVEVLKTMRRVSPAS